MKKLTKKQQKEFNKFVNIQMLIFRRHCERIGQRIVNKIGELESENN